MLVNLIKQDRIFPLSLPEKVSGQFWITDLDCKGSKRNLLSVESDGDHWQIHSNRFVCVFDSNGNPIDSAILQKNSLFYVKIIENNERALIYVENVDHSRHSMAKVIAKEPCVLNIGRNTDNSICFQNTYVSSQHACLTYDGECWSIKDTGSSNGTYLNKFRVQSSKLLPGDLVYIMGLRIIIGSNYIAVNNPDGCVSIRSESLKLFPKLKPRSENYIVSSLDLDEKMFYSRSPRFSREIEHKEISIDPPPQPEIIESVPMALMLGPSLTMAVASLSVAFISIINIISKDGDFVSIIPTILMAVSMLLAATLWPILTKKNENKKKNENEAVRQRKYLDYLDEVRKKIRRIAKEQSDIMNENIISLNECAERILREKTSLWERIIGQNDFLNVRIGIGDLPIDLELRFPEKRFSLTEDNLQDEMFKLAYEPKMLKNVPISLSLVDNNILGVFGDSNSKNNFIKSLVLQLIALHSYDELKIMMICDDNETEKWDFVKYIPHFWTNDKSMRFYATSVDEVKNLSVYLDNKVIPRAEERIDNYSVNSPYYVLICTCDKLAQKCDAINRLISMKFPVGFSTVFLGNGMSDFPKETSAIIRLNGQYSQLFYKNDTSGESITFDVEKIDNTLIKEVSEKIASIELDLGDANYVLPTMLDFLQMYGVGKVEHLNCLSRWKENDPVNSLKAPVGVDATGDMLYLDLHEKFHGPHGLVAGMTGSGKSEFIITYILSMAINYHPDEVSFILIDYKGGGLVNAFINENTGVKLPHLAGTITNLDGSAINRSLVSIHSELKRREALFSKANQISNSGTMDIYKYQKLYRNNIVSEPCPHLFIVSDEFAELKKQQPEFMDELISTARIGRSLGVHLILATQKPSGVVDDQIWSNSKFRVCLKVQEKADSFEMIKRSDAAEISETGRFYLQVGYDELFVVGQSAYCGADYTPSDIIEKSVDNSINVVDNLGRSVLSVSPNVKKSENNEYKKQLVEIVNYLSFLALEEDVKSDPLWLPVIPEKIFVDDIEAENDYKKQSYLFNPVIGKYDDPSNQRQSMLTLPISKDGNSFIYGSTGSGKATYLTTVCYSLLKNHNAEEVNIYIMDFGSEVLKMFENAPQVGGVVTSSDEIGVYNLFRMLKKEIEERKILFSKYGGEYNVYNRNSEKKIPGIIVILNNYSAFSEMFDNYSDDFVSLTRDGIRYGIYFIVSADSMNSVRFKVQQNFKTNITLKLNDETDYSMIVGRTNGIIPSDCLGRGLVKLESVHEFQTAFCSNADDIRSAMQAFCSELSKNSNSFAKPVPMMPSRIIPEMLLPYRKEKEIPVGISAIELEPSYISLNSSVIPVLSDSIYDEISFASGFSDLFAQQGNTVVIDPNRTLKTECFVTDQVENAILDMFKDVHSRAKAVHEAKTSNTVIESFEPHYYILFGFSDIFELLSDVVVNKVNDLLEHIQEEYKTYIFMFDSEENFSDFRIKSWFKKQITGLDGFWVGQGIQKQSIFRISRSNSLMDSEYDNEYGYSINRGKPTLVKLLEPEKR